MTLQSVGLGPPLVGRAAEVAAVDELLDGARAGRSGSVVVRGEAGIGKSALLDHVRARAGGMRVLSAIGVEAESGLPYAGLHLLLGEALDGIDALPPAQAQALRGALGLGPSDAADRFLVGLAVLTLLSELGPLLCVVDDAHWLDRASLDVLLFAARRLAAEGVVMIFATREFPEHGLDELALARLDEATARELLSTRGSDLPRHVREQLVFEADGNPLALVELAAAHRAGRGIESPFGPQDPRRRGGPPRISRVEREFAARVAELPVKVQTLLLVAAADGTCDTGVVLAAAKRLGCTVADLEAAEQARMLMYADGCIGFLHPLIRTAVYGGASMARKQEAHQALVDVLDEKADPDRRAWHRAAASVGPDEEIAKELERSAERAAARGSPEAAATAYERSVGLTVDAEGRGRRLLAAAEAATDAAQHEWATALLARAEKVVCGPVPRARLALVKAALADQANRHADATDVLHDAAVAVAGEDPDLASELLMWLIESAWATRDPSVIDNAVGLVERIGLPGAHHVRALARVAAAQLAGRFDEELPGSVEALRDLVGCSGRKAVRALVTLANWHLLLGDHDNAHELAEAAERTCRARGVLGVLPRALAVLAVTRWHRGKPRDAIAAATEGLRIARDIGQYHAVEPLADVLAQLMAVTGNEPPRIAAQPCTLVDLGIGRSDVPGTLADLEGWQPLPDFVETAARAGHTDEAREAADRFVRWADGAGRAWAAAVALRCQALVADDRAAGRLFAEAVELHRREGGHPFERARTELLHGEWLRRGRQRAAARTPLRTTLEIFEGLGAQEWAARARAELRATGDSRDLPSRDPDVLAGLTPQELQVVRLAAGGLSNRDIGAQLFLSPRTVAYHLYKAFPKLGVASRAQLTQLALPA